MHLSECLSFSKLQVVVVDDCLLAAKD